MKRNKDKILISIVISSGVLFFLSMIGITIYQHFVQEPKAAIVEQTLKTEFDKITPLPGTTVLNTLSDHKATQALIDTSYYSALSDNEIRTYYEDKLTKNGWKFFKEEPIIYRGKNYGGKHFSYKKDNFVASVETTGSNPYLHQTYTFAISWGLSE